MFSRFRSLRWRIQAWYTGLLIMVIVGLSSILHWQMVRSQWNNVDEDLLNAARIIEGSMLAVPEPILDSMAKNLSAPPGPRSESRHDRGRGNPPIPRRPIGKPNDAPERPTQLIQPGRDWIGQLNWSEMLEDPSADRKNSEEWEASIKIPNSMLEQLGRDAEPAYYLVWRNDGSLMQKSNVPKDVSRHFQDSNNANETNSRLSARLAVDRYVWQQIGPWREIYIRGPRDSVICVGRSIRREEVRIGRQAWTLALSGVSTLLFGTLLGWWITNRAIAPIKSMSEIAQNISANRLSSRMNTTGIDLELGGLANVLNQMLERLEGTVEKQKQFASDASHELRTPLSVILNSSELALSKVRTSEEYREQFEKCYRAAGRMRDLVDSLLALARLDALTSTAHFTSVDVNQIVADSIQCVSTFAEEKAIGIAFNAAKGSPSNRKVLGDSIQLEQAFTNLLTNAIKFSQPATSVAVDIKSDDSNITIEVTDQGIGIHESDLPHIFERFYRADSSRSSKMGGTGLGLSIAERIVHAHKGSIGVRSVLHEGSTFWIRLPFDTT